MLNKANGKGPWSFEEDNILLEWVKQNGPQKWSLCSETIPGRSGKQCRERWFNNLNPNVKKGNWTAEEDDMIFKGYLQFGSSWSRIAKNLEGRTENSVKNRFYSTVRKLLSDSEKNGVKTSEQQIRNIIEMSLGQKVGGIQPSDMNEDEESLEGGIISECKNEEMEEQQGKDKEQQQCEGDDIKNNEINDNKKESFVSQNIKQEHDVIKIEAASQDQVNIAEGIPKQPSSQKEILPNAEAIPQKCQDNQLEDAGQQNLNDEEMSSHPSSQQEVTKRKYNRKRHQDEYSESNLLYRLLKSNDVAIKSSKCLQDYSVFYRKYKQNKYDDKKKQRNGDNQEDDDRSGNGDNEAANNNNNNNNSCDESDVKQSDKLNMQSNQNNRDRNVSHSKKEKKKIIQEQVISGENSRKKLKTNEPDSKYQQDEMQDCDGSQSDAENLENLPEFEDSELESGSQKNNIQEQEDNDQEDEGMQFGKMESQLIKYFQKSMGQFLKKFLKKSKTGSQGVSSTTNSKEGNNKTKKNRSKSNSTASQMQQQQQQSNQVSLQNQIKEQISKQFEKLKGASIQQNSSQSSLETPDENKTYKGGAVDLKKINKLTTIIQESPSNRISSLPQKKNTQIKQEDTTADQKLKQPKQQQAAFSQNSQELNTQLSDSSGGLNHSNPQNPQAANPPINSNFQSSKSSFVLNKNSTHLSQQSLHKIGSSSSLNSQPLNNNQNMHTAAAQPPYNQNTQFGINPLQNPAQKVQVAAAPAVSQNLDIESLKNLINNNLLVNMVPGQEPGSAPNSQVDQKMVFLLNQLCTLESMLTNTKQELVKLEESLYQQAPNPIANSNGGRISSNQNNLNLFSSFDQQLHGNGGGMPSAALSLNHLASFNSRNNFERNENTNDLTLKRQNSKDNVSQYSDFDKFINHGS